MLVSGSQGDGFQNKDEQSQAHGQLRKNVVEGNGEREVQAVHRECGVHSITPRLIVGYQPEGPLWTFWDYEPNRWLRDQNHRGAASRQSPQRRLGALGICPDTATSANRGSRSP